MYPCIVEAEADVVNSRLSLPTDPGGITSWSLCFPSEPLSSKASANELLPPTSSSASLGDGGRILFESDIFRVMPVVILLIPTSAAAFCAARFPSSKLEVSQSSMSNPP